MFAVASLFDPQSKERIWDIWNKLESRCGLNGIKATPYPHFSWLGFDDMDWMAVRERLIGISNDIKPFQVQTAGLGIFTGKRLILYISLVKTPLLLAAHKKIWKSISASISQPNPFYAPNRWMPHITIAYGDLDAGKLSCALDGLVEDVLDFTINIDNISVIFQTPFSIGIREEFQLSG